MSKEPFVIVWNVFESGNPALARQLLLYHFIFSNRQTLLYLYYSFQGWKEIPWTPKVGYKPSQLDSSLDVAKYCYFRTRFGPPFCCCCCCCWSSALEWCKKECFRTSWRAGEDVAKPTRVHPNGRYHFVFPFPTILFDVMWVLSSKRRVI